MKKVNLKNVFESLVRGDSKKAQDMFHTYAINEGVKINRKLKESEEFDDAIDGKEQDCSISICLDDSNSNSDEMSDLFDEIFDELEIEADVTFDEEENKFTLTFDTEDEADNFISELTDKVNSLEIDDIEIDDGSTEELEESDEKNTNVSIITKETKVKLKHYVDWFNNYFEDNSDGYIDSVIKGSFTKNTIRLVFRDKDAAKDALKSFSNENDGDYEILIDGKEELEESGFDPDKDFYSDKEEKIMEKTINDFDFDVFIKEYGSDFAWDERNELDADDKVLTKEDVVDAIAHYLVSYSERFLDTFDINPFTPEDFKLSAEELFDDEVADKFEDAGYTFSVNEGKDIGKPGKNFAKIEKSAAKEYGSKEAGERVAGAVLAKLRKEHPRKYSAKNIKEDSDELGNNESPIDVARRMGYHDAKDGNRDRYNTSLRALMNNVPGGRQRRDIHNAYIEGMDDFKSGKDLNESAEDTTLILKKVYKIGQECGRTCHEAGDEDGIVKRKSLRTIINNHRKEIENKEITKDELVKEFNRGFENFKGLREATESSDDYELKLTFPSDGDSFIVDKIESKLEKRDFDFDVTYNDIDDNGIRIFRVNFKSEEECEKAKDLIEDFLEALDVEDFDLTVNEDKEEITETEDFDIDIEDCDDSDKLDLILSKISELEDQIDSLSDISGEAEETALDAEEDEMEEELPELSESYFQKEEDELMRYLNKSDETVNEDYKLEPVDTKKYINKDLKDDESPFSEVDLLRLDLRKAGIADPSVDNAKGYDWRKPSYKDANSVVKGEIKNREQPLKKVNPYDKDSILNKPYGKENDISPMSKINENKRKILRKRK